MNQNRGEVLLEEPNLYNAVNWLTMGAADAVSGAIALLRRFYCMDLSGLLRYVLLGTKKTATCIKRGSDDLEPLFMQIFMKKHASIEKRV